ncbi:MAG: PD40 domain-containing protein [Saprospirales bacterium]|nr:PD40 domain-containing protein [Saprospirales bacterium]
MIKVVAGILFVSGMFLSACTEKPAPAAWKIAYNVWENTETDNYEVYIMNMDGSGKKNITNHPDVAWVYYAWKDKLYFVSDRDTCHRCYFLYEMDSEGNGVRKVTSLPVEDSWMGSRLDGKEMVITGRIGDELRYQLFLIDVQTGDFQQLTHDTTALHRDPVFTPDGRQIAFVYKANRRNRNTPEELWIMEADAKNPRQLTHYPAADTSAEWYAYHAGPPRWHPGEGYFSYQSKQKGKYSLFAVTPDGKQHLQLTDQTQNEGRHDWSPDGKWLAVELFDDAQTTFNIYLMNWQTRELKRLTDSAKYEQAPVFVE